jgi:hypothetical protein
MRACAFSLFATLVLSIGAAHASPSGPEPGLHATYDSLLARYLVRERVRYQAWWADNHDRGRLTGYIDLLEQQQPSIWRPDDAKAYWINLFNALAIDLVLEHYPIDSVKDIGFMFSRAYGKKLVVVEGREISLDNIEHEILRKRYRDPRVLLVLNRASKSSPPLRKDPFQGDSLEAQLDEVVHRLVNDPRYVQVSGRQLHLSKLFEWYKDDFKRSDGSVEAFLARYRDDLMIEPKGKYWYDYLFYDWDLNEAR